MDYISQFCVLWMDKLWFIMMFGTNNTFHCALREAQNWTGVFPSISCVTAGCNIYKNEKNEQNNENPHISNKTRLLGIYE